MVQSISWSLDLIVLKTSVGRFRKDYREPILNHGNHSR